MNTDTRHIRHLIIEQARHYAQETGTATHREAIREIARLARTATDTGQHIPTTDPNGLAVTEHQIRDAHVQAWAMILEAHCTATALREYAQHVRALGVTTASGREWPARLRHVELWTDPDWWQSATRHLIESLLASDDDPMRPMMREQYDYLVDVIATKYTRHGMDHMITEVTHGHAQSRINDLALICLTTWFPEVAQ